MSISYWDGSDKRAKGANNIKLGHADYNIFAGHRKQMHIQRKMSCEKQLTVLVTCVIVVWCGAAALPGANAQSATFAPSPANVTGPLGNTTAVVMTLGAAVTGGSATFTCSVGNLAGKTVLTVSPTSFTINAGSGTTQQTLTLTSVETSGDASVDVTCSVPAGSSSNYAGQSYSLKATSFVTFAIDFTAAASLGNMGLLIYDGDLTPCVCDYLKDECDPNCCCDSSCTATETVLFTQCDDIVWNQRYVNEHWCNATQYPEIVVKNYDTFLCIETVNTASRGLFFTTPSDATDVSTFASETVYESFYYNASSPTAIQDLAYSYSVPVQTFNNPTYGFLSLPQSFGSASSLCSDLSAALYIVGETVKCTRTASMVASCTSSPMLDWNTYSTNAFPVKSAGNANTTISYSSSFQCATVGSNGALSLGTCASTTLTLSGTTCQNAVLQVNYLFTWSGSSLSAVAVSFVLGNIETSVGVQQQFSTEYRQTSTSTTSKSGNPGYIVGNELLYGALSGSSITRSTSSVLNAYITGTTSLAQTCSGANRGDIAFGYSSSGGCLYPMTVTDFSSCDTVRSAVNTVQSGFVNAVQYVGQRGNADTGTVSDWIAVTNASIPTVTTSDVTGTCSNVLSGVTLEVIYTMAGTKDAPQRKVVGARFVYTYSNWSMSCSSVTCRASSASENFFVSNNVDFIPAKETDFYYSKPSLPTFINSADTDLFYLFRKGYNNDNDESTVVTYTLWTIGILLVSLIACLEY
eukprot:Nk52_evm92s151 gene=Nk52_evmTU92s151